MGRALTNLIRGIWSRKLQAALLAAATLGAGVILFWAVFPGRAPAWTGFGRTVGAGGPVGEARSLWDWLELLLIPAALVIGAWWLGLIRTENANARHLAELRAKIESEVMGSRQQEQAIQTYLDRMSALLLEHGLRDASADDEVRRLAQARTRAALWGLDGERKGILARFLYESLLIQQPEPIVSLSGANLDSANLREANLSEADLKNVKLRNAILFRAILHKTDLRGADLAGADLRYALETTTPAGDSQRIRPNLRGASLVGANLSEADLKGADLSKHALEQADLRRARLQGAILRFARLEEAHLDEANLRDSNLTKAELKSASLRGADLRGAKLVGADLSGADLGSANLSQANLRGANLTGADLRGANLARAFFLEANLRDARLEGASLSGTNLSGADLTGASLGGADMRGVYLTSAKVTDRQLARASSLAGSIMPNNSKYRRSETPERRPPPPQVQTFNNFASRSGN